MAAHKPDSGPPRLTRINSQVPFQIATYQNNPARRHAKNKFICALPALPDDATLREKLSNQPVIARDVLSLPKEVRLVELATVDDVVIALDKHVDFARALILNQIQGYEPRGPNTPDDIAYLRELYAEAGISHFFSADESPDNVNELSFGLIGSAGSGKSFTTKSIVKLFPRAIYHKELRRWQLPCVRLEMVFDGKSRNTLATELFIALDLALPGANYFATYVAKCKLNAETRLYLALRFAREHGVGVIIVDEAQRQPGTTADDEKEERYRKKRARSDPSTETPLLRLLVTASNTAHIPLCICGSTQALDLLGAGFSNVRRVMGRGSAIWGPLEPTFELGDPRRMGEFEHYMTELFKYQWIKTPLELNKGVLVHFWELSKGVPDVITKLFRAAQTSAIVDGGKAEVITPQLLDLVYRQQLLAGHLHLQQLASANPEYKTLAKDTCHPSVTPLHLARVARARRAAGIEPAEPKQGKSVKAAKASATAHASKGANGHSDAEDSYSSSDGGLYGGMLTTGAQARAALVAGHNSAGAQKRE